MFYVFCILRLFLTSVRVIIFTRWILTPLDERCNEEKRQYQNMITVR